MKKWIELAEEAVALLRSIDRNLATLVRLAGMR